VTAIPAPGSVSFEDMVTRKVPFDWGYGSTPRTAKLQDELYFKASTIKEWGAVFAGMFDSSAMDCPI